MELPGRQALFRSARIDFAAGPLPPSHTLDYAARVRAVDAQNFTMTVEAGCILSDLQQAAAQADRLFPLSLAAQGSCQIGGNLSTNAGGTQVLRYGNARELVLGLEVVLPDGQVLDLLRGLRKDNTGYDLKHLFCGAEGTLGIITAAVLKLFPRPKAQVTALLALPELPAALALLGRARAATSDALTAFEFIPRRALEFVLRNIPGTRDPFPQPHPHYLLLEASATADEGAASLLPQVMALLDQATTDGLILDAVLAQSPAQAAALPAASPQGPGRNPSRRRPPPARPAQARLRPPRSPRHPAQRHPAIRGRAAGHRGLSHGAAAHASATSSGRWSEPSAGPTTRRTVTSPASCQQ